MNIMIEIKRILKLLNWDVDKIVHDNSRLKWPDAGYMVESANGNEVLYINAGQTALARWGLFEIIIHEFTHKKLKDRGYKNWKKHDEEFMKEYFKIRKVYEDMID